MQAAAGQGVESWGSSKGGPAGSYQDSIKAEYVTADSRGADSMLQVGSEAYDEHQQMEQINKLLHEEQVCTGLFVCLDAHLSCIQQMETAMHVVQLTVMTSSTSLRQVLEVYYDPVCSI